MPRRRSRFRDLSEYLLARAVLAGVRIMPARCLAPTSRMFGRLLHAVLGGRRRVIAENLDLAYGARPDRPDAARIGRAAFAHVCLNFMELQRFPWNPERARDRIRPRDPEALSRLAEIQREGGLVIAAAHFGAYEVGGLAAPLFGIECTSVARPLDNRYLDRWLRRARERFGQKVVSNRGGMGELLANMKNGESGVVLVDLNHRKRRRVWVDFFGQPAATAPTAAVLALKTGRPLVTLTLHRARAPLTFEFEVGALHRPDPAASRDSEIHRLLQAVTREIEDRIDAAPGQWLWTQRRWKTRPEAGECTAPAPDADRDG